MATQWKFRTIAAAVGMALAAPAVMANPTGVAHATATNTQVAGASFNFAKGSTNSATTSNNVLRNASGNIGLNVAAGNSNMQVNNTDIALANGSLLKNTTASSVVNNLQWSNIFSASGSEGVVNTATAADHVLQNATGKIGLNLAAGAANMQGNSAAVSSGLGVNPGGQASAAINSGQISGPFALTGASDNNDTATLSNRVLQNASGDIGVNAAAGDENLQGNNLAVSYNRSGVDANAAAASFQAAGLIGAMTSGADNDATLANRVLQNATGNIGANLAAGQQNMQANSLSLADTGVTSAAGSASASTSNNQNGPALAGSENFGSDNDASLSNVVLQNASGHIGVNAAAGTQNMQANNASIAMDQVTTTGGAATSSVANGQNAGPFGGSYSYFGDDDAFMTNRVLQNASGDVNANLASGADNMQANNMGLAYNHAGASASSAIDNDQGSESMFSNSARGSVTFYAGDNAYLNDRVLQNATGNVGANLAAGEWNEQGNNLAISDAAGAAGSSTAATAAIADTQASNQAIGYYGYSPSTARNTLGAMTASLSKHVLQNASGNIGVNVASGVQNAQANNTSMALGWGTVLGGPATASIVGAQTSGPYSIASETGARNGASVTNHVLQNATGNIGANVSAGVQNMQSNDLAYAFDRGGSTATALTQVSQVSIGAIVADQPSTNPYVPVTNTATVSNHVLQNASGNVGLNVSAGAANMQRNTLSIADAD